MEHVDAISRIEPPNEAELELADRAVFSLNSISLNEWNADTLRREQEADKEWQTFKRKNQCILTENGVWTFQGRPWVPKTMREALLLAYHYAPWGAHASKGKTLKKLGSRYFWPNQIRDIKRMCSNCLTCQRRGRTKTNKQTYDIGALNARQLFDTAALDVVGPFLHGVNEYLLLSIIDHFLKWSEVAVMTNQEAGTIAEAFIVAWVQRYGVPRRVLTDRGANFTKAFQEACAKALGTRYVQTSPYHPEGNGVCEAFNNYLKTTIPKIILTSSSPCLTSSSPWR